MLDAAFDLESPPVDTQGSTAASCDWPQLAAECRARASLYRILAGVFVEEATPTFVQSLRAPSALRALQSVGVSFDRDFLAVPLPELVETLACEYATVFSSSGCFPPVESVRLTGRYKQEPEFQVSRLYQRLGFEVRRGRFELFADQLGLELMLVAELLTRAAASADQADATQYRQLDKEIKRFWAQHLGLWVRGYGALVTHASSHSFYREMGRFLSGFAQEEIEAMGLLKLEDLDRGQLEVPKSEIQLEFNPDEPVCNGCGDTETVLPPPREGTRVIPIAAVGDLAF